MTASLHTIPELPIPDTSTSNGCYLELSPQVVRSHFNRRPFFLPHNLSNHPLFALPRLVELARSLDESYVDYNAGDLPVSIDYRSTPRNGLTIEETIHGIEHCSSWMVLKRVEQDPEYAALLNRCLDELQPLIEPLDPGMYDRAGAIFISSPGSVTPYHMDEEYNFLAQIRGGKTIHVFDAADRGLLSDREIERYYTPPRIDRNLVFQPRYQEKAYPMHLSAGKVLHIPPLAPHWVKNGPEVSISFSLGFLTRASFQRQVVCSLNRQLRERGLSARPYGQSPSVDRLKYKGVVAFSRLRSPADGARTRQSTQHIAVEDLSTNGEAISAQLVDDPQRLAFLREPWRQLLRESITDEPTLSPQWLLPWWTTFGGTGNRELRAAVFFDRQRMIGMVPMQSRRRWYRRGLPFQRLEMLGCGEPAGERTFSDYLGPLAARGSERAVVKAFVRLLSSGALGPWDETVFSGMNGDGPYVELLSEALRQAGFETEVRITGQAPYAPLGASWEDYLASLSPSGRYLVRRSLGDFKAWAGDDWRIEEATSPREVERGREILASLHERRWSDENLAGVFESPRFYAFHQEVMRQLHEENALQLCWLTAKGQPVAAIYNIIWNGKVYFYQSGRETALPRGLRPGIVLHAHAIQQAIERGLREYDFLDGTSQYKRKLAPRARPIVRVRAAQGTLVERLREWTEPPVRYARLAHQAWRARRG